MQLYLIRHAQSQNNALPPEQRIEDPQLTALGQRQAALLAEWTAELRLTRLITSPFRRTLETAEHLRRSTGLVPDVRIELHELGGCVAGVEAPGLTGRPGMSRDEILHNFPDYEISAPIDEHGWWKSQPHETVELAQVRAKQLVEQTVAEFGTSDERVAYVMHADIKMLFLACCEYHPVDVPFNGSVTKVRVTGDAARLEEYNMVPHLPDTLRTF